MKQCEIDGIGKRQSHRDLDMLINPFRGYHFAGGNRLIDILATLAPGRFMARKLLLYLFKGSKGRLDHENPKGENDQNNSQRQGD